MKKLSKLKLKDFQEINDSEMKSIVGGFSGSGTYDDPYLLPELTVYGCYCAACADFDKRNNPLGLSGGDKSNSSVFTPFGEYVMKEYVLKHASCCAWN